MVAEVVDAVDAVDDVGIGGVKTFSGGLASVQTKCERVYNQDINSSTIGYFYWSSLFELTFLLSFPVISTTK